MIAINRRTMTYTHDDYMVDIVSKPDLGYEAWIYKEEYGDKHFMFGMPHYQQSYFEFYEIVRDNVENYKYLCEKENNYE